MLWKMLQNRLGFMGGDSFDIGQRVFASRVSWRMVKFVGRIAGGVLIKGTRYIVCFLVDADRFEKAKKKLVEEFGELVCL